MCHTWQWCDVVTLPTLSSLLLFPSPSFVVRTAARHYCCSEPTRCHHSPTLIVVTAARCSFLSSLHSLRASSPDQVREKFYICIR
jgi:hypothetical protein